MEKNQTKPDNFDIKPPPFLNKVEQCRNCNKRESSLCAVLACDELDRLEEIMTPMKFTPGQTIFTEGDDLTHYYTLSDGVIRLVKFLPDGRRAILDFLYKGDFLGLNLEGHYSYSAEAVTNIIVCCFTRQKLQAMFDDIPIMKGRLMSMFMSKLVSSQNQMAGLGRMSPRERLAAFLLHLAAEPALKHVGQSFVLPMPREDIADFLGLTIETVSRTFSAFAKESLIGMEKRNIIQLKNEPALQKLAQKWTIEN
ncbi:MAG: Crp/Fnr family transcriptional regulator [Alphaproteobacteria bacterium]|nr:MAG: Crp/Fnr family transcriptional regulator [Alphaproteobacteria bacterium]